MGGQQPSSRSSICSSVQGGAGGALWEATAQTSWSMVPSTGVVGSGFLLVQNYILPHVAKVGRHFLDDEGIDVTNWLSRSSDLNSIPHIWDIMVSVHPTQPSTRQTVQELTHGLIQVWKQIPRGIISWLIRNMPRCCRGCIQARRAHTRFWVTLWVVVMKFTQLGWACDFKFSLWIQSACVDGFGSFCFFDFQLEWYFN